MPLLTHVDYQDEITMKIKKCHYDSLYLMYNYGNNN